MTRIGVIKITTIQANVYWEYTGRLEFRRIRQDGREEE
jgi:hypothetical protein